MEPFSLSPLLHISAGTQPGLPRMFWVGQSGRCNGRFVGDLVIEDDETIQNIVEEALAEGGFESAIAASGEESRYPIEGKKTPYRALVTDINLKGTMDGWEVGKHAREIDPEFPIVYMTGAAADQWASNGVPNSILLTKPFAPAQLVTAVSQLLNGRSPTA
jgi:DNA-binding response OmpR family regulator